MSFKKIPIGLIIGVVLFIALLAWWQNSDSTRAYFILGKLWQKAERADMAVRAFLEADKLDTNYPNLHYNLGLAYYELGRYEESIAEFQKELKLQPSYVDIGDNLSQVFASMASAFYRKGLVEKELGDSTKSDKTLKDALEYCRKASALNTFSIQSLKVRGQIYQALGMPEEARQDFERVTSLAEPGFEAAQAHYFLGLLYARELKSEKDAIRHWNQALELETGYALVYFRLGEMYYQNGVIDSAIAKLKKAVQYEQDFVEAHHLLAKAYLRKGLNREAKQEFMTTIRELEFASRRIKTLSGEGAQTQSVVLQHDKIVKTLTEALTDAGTLYYQDGERQKAKEQWLKALKLDKDNITAKENLAKLSNT